MQDFDTSDVLDDDGIEITDLDSVSERSSSSLLLVLLKFVRKIPFLVNTRAKNTALSLLLCGIALLFLLQPDLTSSQASRTRVQATTSSLLLASPAFIVDGSSPREVTWIKISNGIIIEIQASPGTIVWHGCKVQHWFIPHKYAHPTVVICK